MYSLCKIQARSRPTRQGGRGQGSDGSDPKTLGSRPHCRSPTGVKVMDHSLAMCRLKCHRTLLLVVRFRCFKCLSHFIEIRTRHACYFGRLIIFFLHEERCRDRKTHASPYSAERIKSVTNSHDGLASIDYYKTREGLREGRL